MSRGSLGGRVPCVEFDKYFVGTKAQLLSAVAREGERHSTWADFLAANYRC